MRGVGGRRLLVAGAAFEVVVSVMLLLIASTTRSNLPDWGGPVDVALAFALVGTAAWIWMLAPKTRDAWALSVGHAAAATIPALVIAAVWFFRKELDLNVLLPGLAWRTFIVLYSVPAALGVWRGAEVR
jgi:hypothetical protein